MESDASRLGWGAVCHGVHTGGRWILSELDFHINYLELKEDKNGQLGSQ